MQTKIWLKRALGCYEQAQVFSGPMFRTVSKKGLTEKATIGDLDTLFNDILRQVQIRFPSILPAHVKIDDEYSVRRSLRRGSTSEAQNQQVPKEVIEANNRWRKHMRSRNVVPSMDMVERSRQLSWPLSDTRRCCTSLKCWLKKIRRAEDLLRKKGRQR